MHSGPPGPSLGLLPFFCYDTGLMELTRLLLGIIMLTMGRRLYWLFLGGAGFIFGFDIAGRLIHGLSHGTVLLIALLAGIAGAMLAVFIQKLAVVVGGFIAGGYLLPMLLEELGTGFAHYHWFLVLIGGIIGSFFMSMLFGWALIILSSILGAYFILQTLHFGTQISKLLFIFLLILGVAIQYGLFERKHPHDKHRD
jgi:hypothetical protein